MSSTPADATNGERNGITNTLTSHATTNPELDLAKLQALPAEQQELFLLTSVSALSRHVLTLEPDDCTAQQFYIKKEAFKVLNLASPSPTRVIRNALGRCLAHVFDKGDRKLLFETVNELVGIISSGKLKTEGEIRTKHAAVACLGDIYGSAGDSAIGLHQLVCSALLKLLKAASNHAGLRAAVLTAFGKIVTMIQGSMDENVARDIWKQGRNHASGDKGSLVVVAACRCLRSLVQYTPYFKNSTDFDKLKSTLFKTFDNPSSNARSAAADCFAQALVGGYSESAIGEAPLPLVKKSKSKAIKRQSTMGGLQDDEEVPSRPESPAPTQRPQDLTLSLANILKTLSTQYVRISTTNKARAAIAICIGNVLQKLGEKTVEVNYLCILEILTADFLGHNNILNNRYRLLISRRMVDTIIQDILGKRILGESGQITAAKAIVNDILKNYPQALKEKPEPSKHTLVVSLSALSSLISSLGTAVTDFSEGCRDGLLQVLQHPSYTVQVYAAACMKNFVLACPQQLLPCLSVCMNSLSRELSLLGTGRNSPRRCIGFAHGLAAGLSASPQRPLYGSVEINSRVLTMATNLLKSSGTSELRVASTQIQVAWTLIGGLMSLGPNFVKIHLSQLLLLWKNALPKVLAKDSMAVHRNLLNASFLTHVRECALGSILAFLQFNSRLLTVDVCKRIATMLQSTTAFLKTLPAKKTSDDISERLTPALQLQDLEVMVRRRVLQCYTKLVNVSPAGATEALLQSNLLTLAISLFADPDNYTPSSLSTSIANAAGTFDSIWEVGDNSGFGVTSLVRGFATRSLPGQQTNGSDSTQQEYEPEECIERLLLSPVCGTLENDACLLYIGNSDNPGLPDPAATEVVNMAIQLFAFVFPLTPSKVQESALEQITTFIRAGSLQRETGRKAAVDVNVVTALLSTLRVACKETKSSPGDITNMAVEKLLQELLRDFVLDPDQYVRSIAYEAIARLCSACGNAFTNQEIKFLVDTIVVNREPSARAGCAMALGCIQTKIGSMAAGYHLKTILNILMSLCNDPHPTVHYWALEAIARVSDAAGLGFSSFVSSTLGMLAKLYVSDTHNPELASPITMNLEADLSSSAAIARCVDALINVLGPDLQDSTKSRELILTLVGYFQQEEDLEIQRASLACMEHLTLYAPGYMDFIDYVRTLQRYIKSDHAALRDVAVDSLYNLMKRNSYDVIKAAEQGFEDHLWLVLDASPSHDGMRNLIRNWLRQTCLSDTAAWLARFQHVLKMTRPKASAQATTNTGRSGGGIDLQDEEVAGFAAAGGGAKDDKDTPSGSDVEPLKWQVTTFAMDCLNDIFILVTKDVATHGESAAQAALQNKVADVVRMAFSASTSGVLDQRIWGLKIIGAVLKMFGKIPDPDFEEAMLLEQYQAQISSALTPAFAADSSPELASEAVDVCASFIATGIVTDVDRMGRILKTLVSSLENFAKDEDNAGIGDLKGLSSNAQVMVKMSVFAAWAELQVASSEQKYLLDVLKPHIGTLTPLWLESLREFARLRFEPDISMTLGPPSLSGSLDTVYAALNRETLLKFYQESWLKLVDAIASLIEQDSEFVFDALDGKELSGPTTNSSSKGADINYRDEPVAFFFVLFGIAFEALATRPGQSESLATREQTLEILRALKKILHPSVSGHAIYRDAIFSETMDLLDRLVLTEGLDVQGVIVEIARALCVAHPAARKQADDPENSELSDDIEQLFELTRIIVLVLSGLLPNLSETQQPVRHQMTEEAILLVKTSLNALVDAAEVFPSIIKTDLHACILHIFATILATPSCQEVIVPQNLSTLKRFINGMTGSRRDGGDDDEGNSPTDVQLLGCLRRFLSIYLNAQKREAPTSLTCVKNCLLAITILFTGGKNHLPASEPLVAKFLDELVDCLTDRMTAKIAANCIRSLLLNTNANNQPTSADHSISRHLLPRLIAFVTNTSPEDPEQARSLIAQTLVQFTAVVARGSSQDGGQGASIAMALVVPTLLSRAATEGAKDDAYRETSARLLELASADQTAFRAVVGAMSEGQRAFMEEVIKSGRSGGMGGGGGGAHVGAGGRRSEEDEEQAPTIALKMNFGG
ncbi:ARM repeat-containing protein [Neurospora crassa]|uniref:HEAT repeat containing protein n=1 Tax=Neurospora crassa (strain ATCC 24698 / 74-OR23-1A / CBS 708.71 / DSM 1257 / FGSC 987) TaxID=367110 RepID=Q7S2X7_NEUCR|nr:HEAT repeat containing protein [Neurospora crassa OR74A]EAA29785.1 HEAT repeat containing protein [Neurospora crassa OR74A]KHE82000.1 ARM repeat-containing protein [Neurospora crassa]|eukprot:XP_959021.1 HEAT repeat containing protein [Neurospora crassa OR74A]